jgi:hypothetical protein
MSSSTRPGSLTLLAALNLIGGGLSVLGALGALVGIAMRGHAPQHGPPGWMDVPSWLAWLHVAWGMVRTALLVASGIGLRQQSPLLGRHVANLYGVLAIAMAAIDAVYRPDRGDGVMVAVLAVFHPLVLMLWINLVVRDVWRPVAVADAPGAGDMRVPRSHVWLNLRLSLRQTLRGAAGPGFVLGYVASGLVVVLVVVELAGAAERLNGKLTGDGRPRAVPGALIESGTRWVLRTVLHEEPARPGDPEPSSAAWSRHLVSEHAPLTSFTWLVFSALAALAAASTSFNQISRDAAQRGFRFLLVRTARRDIYAGRFLAAALLAAGASVTLVAVAAVALGLAQPGLAWGPHVAWSAWAALALVLTTLPYVALGLWFSTLFDAGLVVLALVHGLVIGLPILALVASAQVWKPLVDLVHVIPAAVQFWLFHPSPWAAAGAAAACLGYTAVYYWLGLRRFQTRDL